MIRIKAISEEVMHSLDVLFSWYDLSVPYNQLLATVEVKPPLIQHGILHFVHYFNLIVQGTHREIGSLSFAMHPVGFESATFQL